MEPVAVGQLKDIDLAGGRHADSPPTLGSR
jgi:hypothetical protein